MKNDYQKILGIVLTCFILTMIASIILDFDTLVTLEYFNFEETNKYVMYILICCSSFLLFSFYWLGIAKLKWYRSRIEFIIFYFTSSVGVLLNLLGFTYLSIIYDILLVTCIPFYFTKNWKHTIASYVSFIILMILFMVSRGIPIKINNDIDLMITSGIDIAQFIGIFYLYRIHGGNFKWLYYSDHSSENQKNILRVGIKTIKIKLLHYKQKTKEQKIKIKLQSCRKKTKKLSRLSVELKLIQMLILTVFSTVTLAFSDFVNKPLEFVVMFSCYVVLKRSFAKEYHTSLGKCLVISCLVFMISTSYVFPFSVSLFNCIIFALAIDFVTCHLQNYLDLLQNESKDRDFNLKTCTVLELETRCNIVGIRGDEKKLCIELFTSGRKIQDIADSFGYERGTVANKKTQLKKQLLNTLITEEQSI